MSRPSGLIQGTLDLLILKTISHEPSHGWAIAKRIQQSSGEVLQVTQGALYPALYRLQRQRLVATEWGTSDANRRAKYYRLTTAGRKRLREETEWWERLAGAIGAALRATPSLGMAMP